MFPGRFLNSEEKRNLASNFSALLILQILNYILPLVNMPYLIRTVGVEKFGIISFAGAIVIYLTHFVSFGFNYTATQEISTHREDLNKVNVIFSSVLTIKLLLLLAAFCVLVTLICAFERVRQEWIVYVFTFGLVVAEFLFPVWFFQGMERMKFITYLQTGAKLFFTVCIFIFIKKQSDYALAPLFTGLGGILAGIASLCIVSRQFKVHFELQSLEHIRKYVMTSFPIFLSNYSALTYRNLNAVILGILTNDAVVGCYAVAEKITYAAQQLQVPFGNALFPFLSRKTQSSRRYFYQFTRKYFKYLFSAYFGYSLAIFLCAPLIIQIFTGEKAPEITLNLRILSFVVMIGGFNYYFGILGLVTMGFKKEFSICMVSTAIFSIVTCFIFVFIHGGIGASMTIFTSESLLLILILYYLFKNNKI